ncbi:hypothetical protein ES319_D13G123000v1 [Gossypium barbadense]|uniref:Uncharacterized protein n=3 Tax=Gossypium TaxID=3633 RepID=A0A5J5NQ36_GOSBA|nr:hypothetical protein ES319_D13G123000v1 [Gossypium barbadense]TYG37291.1 hypothetical protein ES288_D13G130000v1 [Gossypium darwinii]TYH34475.1 hypothetical protein ES332_D13G130900v1 [Gossypium tomentosum]TYH34476.1 hypothetical protein ES332_D13G130900v1 [Gossypium tomentosum]TYH34477.1 hypothetical protein ES332_D13G130900v1 [Gossypium tomentosum]
MDTKSLLLTLVLIHGLLVSQTEAVSRFSFVLIPSDDHRHGFVVVSKRDINLSPPPPPDCNPLRQPC